MASLADDGNEIFDALSLRIREKLLNPILLVNLGEMCLRKIVVDLWNADDMLISIQNFQSDEDFRKKWRETLEVQMKYKVLKLRLPESLEKEVLRLVRPVGLEILRWKTFHELLLYKSLKKTIDKQTLKQLHWTCTGAIDYLKTMHELLRLEMFDVEERYRLACSYCLENEIRVLWEQLPEKRKCQYRDRRDICQLRDMQLEYYWPYVLMGEEHLLPRLNYVSFNNYAFNAAASLGNKMVIEHFLHKLTSEERDFALLRIFNIDIWGRNDKMTKWRYDHVNVRLGDVFYYLLSVMNPTQQMLGLKGNYLGVLFCLHDWPWHEVFLDVLNVIWTFLHENVDMNCLMYVMWNSGYYSPNLFQKVFKDSPKYFRRYFVSLERRHFYFFREFFLNGDTETVKVVFENLDVEEILRLVSCYGFFQLVDGLIMGDKWDLFELCFGEAALSDKDKNGLKDSYKKFLKGTDPSIMAVVGPEESREHRWKRAFDLLDELEAGASNKRNLEDEVITKDKRLCNVMKKNNLRKSLKNIYALFITMNNREKDNS